MCIYTVEYYATIKKNEIMPFAATHMDIEMKWNNKNEKYIYYMWNLKYDTRWGDGIVREFGTDVHTVVFTMDNQ